MWLFVSRRLQIAAAALLLLTAARIVAAPPPPAPPTEVRAALGQIAPERS